MKTDLFQCSGHCWSYGYRKYFSDSLKTRNYNIWLKLLAQSTKGSKPGLLHCNQLLYQLSHKGYPRILEREAYPFSRWSSQTSVSCIAGRFFTNRAIREAHKVGHLLRFFRAFLLAFSNSFSHDKCKNNFCPLIIPNSPCFDFSLSSCSLQNYLL